MKIEYYIINKKRNSLNYNEALSDFMYDVASELGGGLPNHYFNENELTELENIFKKIFDATIEFSILFDKKNY